MTWSSGIRITAYAEELLDGLEHLDSPDHILAMQRNWIGKSDCLSFDMAVDGRALSVTIFMIRPDTVCGMTFAVLAPDRPLRSRSEH